MYSFENVKFKSILYYKHSKPPTCTCFGYTCGYPQGRVCEGCIRKALPI